MEPETRANADYMNSVVKDADLYVTMHTGVDNALPVGKWQNARLGIIPWYRRRQLRHIGYANSNANRGLYPIAEQAAIMVAVMGFPTFTFETDDDQFLPVHLRMLTSA